MQDSPKEVIIKAAIDLFNKEGGIHKVTLHQIATNSFMVDSNLHYHFHTKQALMEEVCGYISQRLEQEIYIDAVYDANGSGLVIIKAYFEFMLKYAFYYKDTYGIISSYPSIHEIFRGEVKKGVALIKNYIYMAIGRGAMKQPPNGDVTIYDDLAYQTWAHIHFWLSNCYLNKEERVIIKGMESCFLINRPYLTTFGIKLYDNFLSKLN